MRMIQSDCYVWLCVVFDVQDSFSAKRPLVVISDAFRSVIIMAYIVVIGL